MITDTQTKPEMEVDQQIRNGRISPSMVQMFLDADAYASTNSMLWLGGRLTLMKERLSICLPIELDAEHGKILLRSVDDLFRWAKETLPGAYACFLK